MAKLIIGRHGETEYNRKGLWTGLTQVDLTERGQEEADIAGRILAPLAIDVAFVSKLRRTTQTAERILKQQTGTVPVISTAALNERNYGIYTGKSKQQVLSEVGEDEFLRIRRSWDGEIEGGETLQDVHNNRIAPFHRDIVLPRVLAGENVLVVSSNNPLRAYVKEVEEVPIDQVAGIELGTAELRVYDFDNIGTNDWVTVHKVGDVH
ncbi:MAG TPA: 2,3-bisphosphoglycerate-dependent phosphoglycerate mutase [Candidatus Dormibacteraeota bacterium]|nr:2,3-bisphosphoglycerate-dependent phosphoglycerate mutase [Candidatus Dormibacteraeota bacterium]